MALLGFVIGSNRIEHYRAQPQQPAILGPLDGRVIDCITFLGKLNEYLELDRSGYDSFVQLIKEVIGRLGSGGGSFEVSAPISGRMR